MSLQNATCYPTLAVPYVDARGKRVVIAIVKATFERGMPLMPLDHDARFDNVAHPSLQLARPPPPEAEIAVLGMSESGFFQCALPHPSLVLHGVFNHERTTLRPAVDTLLIEPARGRIELVYRAVFAMGRGKTSLREIRVDTDA
jgi:hypothetical protein